MRNPSFDEVQEARKHFLELWHEYWLEHVLFTWQWWLLLLVVIISWTVWWKFVDKKRIHVMLNFGFILAIISVILDMVGVNHMAWPYPICLYWSFIPPC